MSRHRKDRVTDQPTAPAVIADEKAVRGAADLAEQYGRLLGRDVLDLFAATDSQIERVEFLRITLIEAAEGFHPSRSLGGLADVIAPLVERAMGLK